MKKSLIALAILGSVAGAAQAQSSVTLYGLADLWVGKNKTEVNGVTTDSTVKMGSGGLNGSRWGLKGTEDLGGGLKALFLIETGFNADTGTGRVTNGLGDRQTYVGLQSGMGTLVFGNAYSVMDDVAGAANSGFDSALSASQNVLALNHGNGPVGGYVARPQNVLKYTSPSFGGLTGAVSYSLDEATAAKKNQTDFRLSYGAGPIAANFAYEVQGDVGTGTDDRKLTLLNGSYDLGMAKVKASFGQSKLADAKSTDVQVGVDVPLSAALTVSAGYAQSKDNAAAGDAKRTGFGLAAGYGLSKRTTAYAGLRTNKTKVGDTTTGKGSLFAVGLRHTF